MTADLQELLHEAARNVPAASRVDVDAAVHRGRGLRVARRRRDSVLALGGVAAAGALAFALVSLPGSAPVGPAGGVAGGPGGITPAPTSGPLVPVATNGAEVYVAVTPGKSPEPVSGELLARWVAQRVAAALPASADVDIDAARLVDVPDPNGAEMTQAGTTFGRVETSVVVAGTRVPLQLALGTGFSILCLPSQSSAPTAAPACTQADMVAGTTVWRLPVSATSVAAQASDTHGTQSWTADAWLPRLPAGAIEQAGGWAEKAALAAAKAITERPYVGDPAWEGNNRPFVTPSAEVAATSEASSAASPAP